MNERVYKPVQLEALRKASLGPVCIGLVDDEEKMAAALVFSDLRNQGLINMVHTPDGPTWSLSVAGEAVLRRWLDR